MIHIRVLSSPNVFLDG